MNDKLVPCSLRSATHVCAYIIYLIKNELYFASCVDFGEELLCDLHSADCIFYWFYVSSQTEARIEL